MTTAAAGSDRFELTLQAVPRCLTKVYELIRQAAAAAQLDEATAGDLRLAVEEACMNVIEHGYPPGRVGPIRVSISTRADRVEILVVDEAPPFDPADVPTPDTCSDWNERKIGGLGLHLIRQVMDEVRYAIQPGGGNQLTLVKYLNIARGN